MGQLGNSTDKRALFLNRLSNDKDYIKYVIVPFQAQAREAMALLTNVSSSEAQIRHAQGQIEILDWHNRLFEHNKIQLESSKDKKTNGPTEPNFTRGRYCT